MKAIIASRGNFVIPIRFGFCGWALTSWLWWVKDAQKWLWFHGSHNRSSKCCSVSSAFSHDEFASPWLSRASQTDRCGFLNLAWLRPQAPIACLLSHPSAVCLLGLDRGKEGKSIHGFRVDLVLLFLQLKKERKMKNGWAWPRPPSVFCSKAPSVSLLDNMKLCFHKFLFTLCHMCCMCLQITNLVAFVLLFPGYMLRSVLLLIYIQVTITLTDWPQAWPKFSLLHCSFTQVGLIRD